MNNDKRAVQILQMYGADASQSQEVHGRGERCRGLYAHLLRNLSQLTQLVLSNEKFWGTDLTKIPGAEKAVATFLSDIRTSGVRSTMRSIEGK